MTDDYSTDDLAALILRNESNEEQDVSIMGVPSNLYKMTGRPERYILLTELNNPEKNVLSRIGVMTQWDLTKAEMDVCDDELRDNKHIKITYANSWDSCEDIYLNLLSRKDWLHPIDGEMDVMTVALLISLSDGNEEFMNHIMECIGWKYDHPEDYMLPAISIYGKQGVGKDILIDHLLRTIFGASGVTTASMEDVCGKFNAHTILGRSIVGINESTFSKADEEALKRQIMGRHCSYEFKYGSKGVVEAPIWYWILSNDLRGGQRLDSDSSTNRRFSVHRVDHDLKYWVAELGLDWEIYQPKIKSHFNSAGTAAIFLNACLALSRARTTVPEAYHGDAYKELIVDQHPYHEYFDDVFNAKSFDFITVQDFYFGYIQWMELNNPGGHAFSKNMLSREANKWNSTNNVTIIKKNKRLTNGVSVCFTR